MSPQSSNNHSFIKELFIFIYFLETLCTHVGLSEKYKSDYVAADSDLNYFEEVPGVSISQSFSEDQTFSYQDEQGTITVLGSPIKFDPPNINFKQQPIGIPVLRKVRVFNINSHSSIQMLSISGNTIHFHCSFFSEKVIPPGGNATFDVVFLGREPGVVENTLYIHTSAGSFRYNVEGEGTPNPYRIRPLVGVKIPVNSSFSPVIQLHNPHPTPMQVLEMYSSGGDLHLELPTGETEADKQMWEIPPYHTKNVMKANFVARAESNHTAYIRIKTNSTGAEFLYLPLEIEVSSTPGIYATQEMVDFGTLSTDGGPISFDIFLLNSGSRAVTVSSLVSNPVTDALTIDFTTVKVPAGIGINTRIGQVTFDPSLVTEEGPHYGKLIIKSKNNQQRVQLPWLVTVYKGGISWNSTFSKFLLTDVPDPEDPSQAPFLSTTRSLTVTNEFTVPVVVHSVLLEPEAEAVFNINKFKAKVIEPGETVSLAKLSVKQEWIDNAANPEGMDEDEAKRRISYRTKPGLNLESHLTLLTNVTSVTIPLVVFDGKLQQYFPSAPTESTLDFGTIGMQEKRDAYFALINKGPVKVVLRGWGGNITGSLIELMGVGEGNETDISAMPHLTGLPRKLYVNPGHFVVYRIGLLTGKTEGEVWAGVFVSTEFQDLHVPFRFRVAKGSLSTVPQEISLGTNFPGRQSEIPLYVHSSFKHQMNMKSLSVVGGDPRFSFRQQEGAVINPGQKSFVGHVKFDPGAVCRAEEECYTGFSPHTKFGHPWYLGLALPLNLGEMDLSIVLTLWSRMRSTALANSQFNVTLRLDTSEVRGFHFPATAALSWPILCLDPLLSFPLTQIGNTTRQEIFLINPSQDPVLVHLVPMSAYPNAGNILSYLPNRIKQTVLLDDLIIPSVDDSASFLIESVTDAEDPFNTLKTFGEDFSDKFGIGIAPNTFPFVLEPGQAAKVAVRFTPLDAGSPLASVLFVRNNLTGVETIDLMGMGAVGDFKFGNRRAGSTIHAFDVTEKHLKDCDKEPTAAGRASFLPNLTVKRPFTARNTGQVPIWVTGFEIDGYPCEGYGFKVLDCEPFELAANDSKRIHIAFTPDFTLARITRTLTMKTSLSSIPGKGDVKYALAATVPAHLLSVCSKSLPRPKWEGYLYLFMISLMLISLICILVAALLESERILKYCYILTSVPSTQQLPDSAKLLDLRAEAREALRECAERERARSSSTQRNQPKLISAIHRKEEQDGFEEVSDLINNTHGPLESADLPVESSWIRGFINILFSYLPDTYMPNQTKPGSHSDSIIPSLPKEVSTSEPARKPIVSSGGEINITPPISKRQMKKLKQENNSRSRLVLSKVSRQNSVNDDMETSSTSTETSNPEEVTEQTSDVKEIVDIGSDLPISSGESGKKKKKKISNKVVDPQPVKDPLPSKPVLNQNKPKKVLEKQDSKSSDKCEKVKPSPKPSRDSMVKPASPSPVTPPPATPPLPIKKQEAKVKGVPKETSELKRQQSLPSYDKPSRLQPRQEIFPASSPPMDGFPSSAPLRADPPRAIIYPEVKREVNQFGAIGCKVPINPAVSTGVGGGWNDNTQVSAQLGLTSSSGMMNPPSPGLISSPPPPGVSIMQQLQAERRYREEEFRRNQWPGFGTDNPRRDYLESLWDSPNSAPKPAATTQQGMWGTLGQNVWPSTVLQGSPYTNSGGAGKEGENDRFRLSSLSSIWSGGNNAGGGRNGSMSAPPVQQQDRDKAGGSNTWSSTLFNAHGKKDL